MNVPKLIPDRVPFVDDVRQRVATGFRSIVSGDPSGEPDWVRQLSQGQDAGYFGPGSAAWAVHGGLPTLVGGVRALLMQALHPGALAGVREHSRYEEDALGRLAGTTQWLTVVTFGDTAAADRECARVRGMHRKVQGQYVDAFGEERSYAAGDPDLLRWVHVAFTDSFLTTHLIWGGDIPGGPDAYVREWAKAGELVGVVDPPRSHDELQDQLVEFSAVLMGGADARDTVSFIRNPPLPLAARPAYGVLFTGAVATLPAPFRSMLGLPTVPLVLAKPMVSTLLGGLSLALGTQSPSQKRARQRIEEASL